MGQAWEGVRESARRSRDARTRPRKAGSRACAASAAGEATPAQSPARPPLGAPRRPSGGCWWLCCARLLRFRSTDQGRAPVACPLCAQGWVPRGRPQGGLSGPAAPGSVHVTHQEALQVLAGSQVGCCAVLAELGRRRSGLWPERALGGEGGARLVRARFCFLVGTPRLPVCGSEDRRVVCLCGRFGKASALMEGRA